MDCWICSSDCTPIDLISVCLLSLFLLFSRRHWGMMDNGECSKRGLVTRRCNFRHGPLEWVEMAREYLLPLPYRHVTDESRKAISDTSLQTQWTVHPATYIKYDARFPLYNDGIIKNQIASLPHSFLWAAPTSHRHLYASPSFRSRDSDTAHEH